MPIHIQVLGRLGKDAVRKTLNNKTIISFSLASDRRRHEGPAWLECDILSGWGEAYFQHLTKGRIVLVTGVLEPNNGFLDVVVDRIEFVGSKAAASSQSVKEEPQPAPSETRRAANDAPRGKGRRA